MPKQSQDKNKPVNYDVNVLPRRGRRRITPRQVTYIFIIILSMAVAVYLFQLIQDAEAKNRDLAREITLLQSKQDLKKVEVTKFNKDRAYVDNYRSIRQRSGVIVKNFALINEIASDLDVQIDNFQDEENKITISCPIKYSKFNSYDEIINHFNAFETALKQTSNFKTVARNVIEPGTTVYTTFILTY